MAGALLAGGAAVPWRAVRPAAGPVTAPAQAAPRPAPPATARYGVQPDRFYDATSFFNGLEVLRTRGLPPVREGIVVGGLVPHHNLAGEMFSRFFVQLEARPPATVIVVGPNHDNRGQPVTTGRWGWSTAFGVVEADQALVTRLEEAGLATVDDPSLEPEHSIGALMPYVKYHAPGAKVVPIVLHRGVTTREMEALAGFLAPLLSADTVLVASVDFSHYLTRAQAEANDAVTLKAILDFDLTGLMGMGPDYVDSPPSLGVLMLAMRRLGAEGPIVEGNTNSGRLFGSDVAETTSYFTFSYRLRCE